jgi:D-alanyl-D-alanine carboxypeptidase (penicillin-binding protein 5/6)
VASLPPAEFSTVLSDAPAPQVTAKAAALIEQSCGALVYNRNAHERLAPASLTKIVTALVTVDRAGMDEMVDVEVNGALMAASNASSIMGLQPGQRLRVRDLLYGLMLPSGNDAALALADYEAGSVPAFAELMNRLVADYGLRNSHFTNPHGLDEDGLYSSAFDMAVLGRKLLANAELAAIVSTQTYQPAWDDGPLWNGNKLLYEYPGATGVKTGTTPKAGQTMVASAERDGRRLIATVLGSYDRYTDVTRLFDWAFEHTTPACWPQSPADRVSEGVAAAP